VLLVVKAGEGFATLDASEVPGRTTLSLAMLVYLVLLESRIAGLTGKDDHIDGDLY
jgi:hypothetical protein